jgi:hypothetical protein
LVSGGTAAGGINWLSMREGDTSTATRGEWANDLGITLNLSIKEIMPSSRPPNKNTWSTFGAFLLQYVQAMTFTQTDIEQWSKFLTYMQAIGEN